MTPEESEIPNGVGKLVEHAKDDASENDTEGDFTDEFVVHGVPFVAVETNALIAER